MSSVNEVDKNDKNHLLLSAACGLRAASRALRLKASFRLGSALITASLERSAANAEKNGKNL